MQTDQRNLSNHPKAKPDKSFRKTVWLQIYLPIFFVIILIAGIVVILWRGGEGSASGWADTALVIMMIPALLVGILIIVIMAGLCYGVMVIIGWIPGPAKRGQEIASRVVDETHRLTKGMMRPILIPKAVITAVMETVRYLASIFKKKGDE